MSYKNEKIQGYECNGDYSQKKHFLETMYKNSKIHIAKELIYRGG